MSATSPNFGPPEFSIYELPERCWREGRVLSGQLSVKTVAEISEEQWEVLEGVRDSAPYRLGEIGVTTAQVEYKEKPDL